jgi:hypothetical protein
VARGPVGVGPIRPLAATHPGSPRLRTPCMRLTLGESMRSDAGPSTTNGHIRFRQLMGPPDQATTILCLTGGLLLIVSAIIHLHLWSIGYRNIPTIGPLFLLQGVAGIMLAMAVVTTRRALVALAGALFAVGNHRRISHLLRRRTLRVPGQVQRSLRHHLITRRGVCCLRRPGGGHAHRHPPRSRCPSRPRGRAGHEVEGPAGRSSDRRGRNFSTVRLHPGVDSAGGR